MAPVCGGAPDPQSGLAHPGTAAAARHGAVAPGDDARRNHQPAPGAVRADHIMPRSPAPASANAGSRPARASLQLVQVMVMARGAQAAPPLDRAARRRCRSTRSTASSGVACRHVEQRQRCARRPRPPAASPAPSACARRTRSRRSRTSSRDRPRSAARVRPLNSAAGSVMSSSTAGSPAYSSTRRRTITASPGLSSSSARDLARSPCARRTSSRRLPDIRRARRCAGCAGSGSATPSPRCASRRTCPCPGGAPRRLSARQRVDRLAHRALRDAEARGELDLAAGWLRPAATRRASRLSRAADP